MFLVFFFRSSSRAIPRLEDDTTEYDIFARSAATFYTFAKKVVFAGENTFMMMMRTIAIGRSHVAILVPCSGTERMPDLGNGPMGILYRVRCLCNVGVHALCSS